MSEDLPDLTRPSQDEDHWIIPAVLILANSILMRVLLALWVGMRMGNRVRPGNTAV